jgi:uncharacterized protein YkwD
VLLEQNASQPVGARYDRWWAAYGTGGAVTLPLVMTDSGHQNSNGPVDYYSVYKSHLDAELARAPGAELTARAWRVGARYRVSLQLGNCSGVTLSAANGATIHAIVYEDVQVGVTSHAVLDAVSANVQSAIADGDSGTFALETRDLAPRDWTKVHVLVLADYRPGGEIGAYDTLQAAFAEITTDWLSGVNFYRSLGGLPWLTENPSWSDGAWKHSRYVVKNDFVSHKEDAANAWYTEDGAAAANGNVVAASSVAMTDREAVDLWIDAPFHAVGMIDPRLSSAGFGSYREAYGHWQAGATLDVVRGTGSVPTSVSFPLAWPADGTRLPRGAYLGTETPDPLTSCSGYTAPTGHPLVVQWSASTAPTVTAHSLLADGVPVAHCVYDETSYTNPDGSAQALARNALSRRHAIVMIPRDPMPSGTTYTASITADGATKAWTFTASCAVTPGSTAVTADADGGASAITVLTESRACAWSTVSDAPSWLHAVSAATVLGSGYARYAVDPNDTGATRTAQIAIAGVVVTLTQPALPAPPGQAVDVDGDGGSDANAWQTGTGTGTGTGTQMGTWYPRSPETNWATCTAVQPGSQAAGDVLVHGDYDGSGKADPAVWRPSLGTRYVPKSSDNDGYGSRLSWRWRSQTSGDMPAPMR